MPIVELVPASIAATDHADALLEVAFLMSAVDGHLADEELAAFGELVGRVRGRSATKDEIGALLERFVFSAHTVGVPDRVREVAKSLPPELRALPSPWRSLSPRSTTTRASTKTSSSASSRRPSASRTVSAR